MTTSGTGTINFNGSGEQAMGAYDTYNNVEISSTGAGVFLDGAVNIGGNLAINSGGLDTNGNTFTFSGTDKTITGTLEISTLQITGSITNNGTLTVGTDLSGAGTLTNGATGILNLYYLPTITTLVADTVGNTVNYTNSGGITVLDVDYYNLNLLGDGTITFGGEIAIANNLSINSGLNLDFGVTNSTTNGLILGGDAKIAGTWGSYGSGATNRNNDYFSGNRLIDVSNLTSAPDVPTAEAGPTIDATEDADGFDVVVSLGTSGAIEGDVLELLLNDESIVVTAGTPGTVGETTYTGTGLGDATFGGQYDGTGEGCQILAGILDLAPENGYDNDRFIFGFSGESCDSGDNSGIEITPGIAQDIESGITITFDAGTGHTLLEMDPLNENWSADLTSGIPDTHVAHTLTSDNILAGSDSFSIPSGVLGLDGEKSFSARIIRVGTNGTESDPLVLTLDTTTDEPEPVRRRSSGSSSVSFNRPTAPTPTPNTEVPSTPNFTFTKNLKFRMNDIEVQELQKFLNNNGFPVSTEGAGSKGFETNFFGAKTRAALVAFQKANNITPAVGYFGPITRGVINGMIQ